MATPRPRQAQGHRSRRAGVAALVLCEGCEVALRNIASVFRIASPIEGPHATVPTAHAEFCRDVDCWSYLTAFYEYILWPLERARRWGPGCSCCGEMRRRGEKPHCPRASKRMGEAGDFIQSLQQGFIERQPTSEVCGNVAWIKAEVTYATRKV